MFFVRSAEQNLCPCCSGILEVIGSRRRGYINGTGEKVVLIIRRLRCRHCKQIHHELPDILVPYKRYGSESLESVFSDESVLTITADESTIGRWRNWMLESADYLLGCLVSIAIRYDRETAEGESGLSQSKLQRIWQHVGDAPGWLSRVVRPVANLNLWLHTRSAFLT